MPIERRRNNLLVHLLLRGLLLAASCSRKAESTAEHRVIRCAVIGGMTMTGLWPEVAKIFEAETGNRVEAVATGPRPELDKVMRAGKVDLLTMRFGDVTTDLVADGFGVNMRPWTRNELCVVGPPDDPAQGTHCSNSSFSERHSTHFHLPC